MYEKQTVTCLIDLNKMSADPEIFLGGFEPIFCLFWNIRHFIITVIQIILTRPPDGVNCQLSCDRDNKIQLPASRAFMTTVFQRGCRERKIKSEAFHPDVTIGLAGVFAVIILVIVLGGPEFFGLLNRGYHVKPFFAQLLNESVRDLFLAGVNVKNR